MRRRNHSTPAMQFETPQPNKPHDHLAGQHFEDYFSEEAAIKIQFPETELQAALNGRNPYESDDREWMTRVYGEEIAKRREWLDHTDPGGKTFKF